MRTWLKYINAIPSGPHGPGYNWIYTEPGNGEIIVKFVEHGKEFVTEGKMILGRYGIGERK